MYVSRLRIMHVSGRTTPQPGGGAGRGRPCKEGGGGGTGAGVWNNLESLIQQRGRGAVQSAAVSLHGSIANVI